MSRLLETGGEVVAVDCRLDWVAELLGEGAVGEPPDAGAAPALVVEVERTAHPFPTEGWEPMTRGAWRRGREVVLENVCATGFDVHVAIRDGIPRLAYRFRPDAGTRLAGLLLRSRFTLLARAVLVQYPALWAAGVGGRAPLHAVVCTAGPQAPLLAGPSGVGKSTLVAMELAAGGVAIGDNLAVSDGTTAWGIVEPARTEAGQGRRTTHGRRESRLGRRVASLEPTSLVILRRGLGERPSVRAATPAEAEAALVAGTYMAGELRRYWAFAATLAAGTGRGPAHPPVCHVGARLAARLPALEIHLPARPGPRLADLLEVMEEAC